jgi:hypothetical protein
MRTRRFVITLSVVAFAFAPQLFRTSAAEEAGDITINSVSPTEAFPGDTVRISWKSSVKDVDFDYFDVMISFDSGAHFRRLARILVLQPWIDLSSRQWHHIPLPSEFAWHVPDGFSGHATFQVVAIQDRGQERKLAESVISAETQVLVRPRPE